MRSLASASRTVLPISSVIRLMASASSQMQPSQPPPHGQNLPIPSAVRRSAAQSLRMRSGSFAYFDAMVVWNMTMGASTRLNTSGQWISPLGM